WSDGIDPYPTGGCFHRGRMDKRDHRRFRSGIERQSGIRISYPADRSIDDNSAPALRKHDRQLMAKAQENRPHIGVEHVVIPRFALSLDRRPLFLEAGIVERDVEPTVAFD